MGHYDECYEYDRQHPRVPSKPYTKAERVALWKRVAEKVANKRMAENIDKIDGECK